MLKEKLEILSEKVLSDMKEASNPEDLYAAKVKHLGKKGEFSKIMKELASVSPEERPKLGKIINEKKRSFESFYETRLEELKKKAWSEKIKKEKLDLSFEGPLRDLSSFHPIHEVTTQIVSILNRMGFLSREGPCVETDWYNFQALNIPEEHPARDEQDTFYVEGKKVLRTHTSPVQIRTLLEEKPPLKIVVPGAVFRRDHDISHSPHFHQIETLYVDKEVSMAHLKGTISYFVKEFFGKDIEVRFRPSFFPFTEPSAEVDCSCPICKGKGCRMCKNSGWIEIGGCGLVHPFVLKSGKVDPKKWQGFAFGFGVERMAIIKYQVDDIRLFFENDLNFLRQFV